jgi:meso-butanediol dehydrogenase / (S,S)-butanediol dehydrogenase / diacetyl reductase
MTGFEAAFRDKVLVITGGGSGIGAATAELFAGLGAHPILVGPTSEPLEAVATATQGIACVGDASDQAVMDVAVAQAHENWGGVDLLVSCAGGGGAGTVLETDDSSWNDALRICLSTAFVASRACLPSLTERSGSIVIVSSVAGLLGTRFAAGYITAKHALLGLVRSLACDYGPAGVRVNAVCPAFTRTPMADGIMDIVGQQHGISRDEAYVLSTKFAPLGRPAEASEIARAIALLASDWASMITGAALPVDAGVTAVDVGTLVALGYRS